MANETLYTGVSALLPEIWEMALYYIQYPFVMPQLVSTFVDQRGMQQRNFSIYSETAATDNLGETVDLTTTEFARALFRTLTPKEIGAQHKISYRRIDSDDVGIVTDAGRNLGYVLGKLLESNLMAQFDNFDFAHGATKMTVQDIFAARARLEANGVPGPYYTVLHPYQYYSIWNEYASVTAPAPLQIRDNSMRSYHIAQIADVSIIVSSLVPRTGTVAAVQTATITGTPTGGKYSLSFEGRISADIAWNATNAAFITAVTPMFGGSVTGFTIARTGTGPNYTFTITFPTTDAFAGKQAPIKVVSDGLTGGTGAVAIAENTEGSATAVGGVFARPAIALDMRRALLLEPDRDPSLRQIELNATMIYAASVLRSNFGVRLASNGDNPLL